MLYNSFRKLCTLCFKNDLHYNIHNQFIYNLQLRAPGEPREEAAVLRRQRLLSHREGPRVAEAADLAVFRGFLLWETARSLAHCDLKLVGGFSPSEKDYMINWDDEILRCMEKNHVPNHQTERDLDWNLYKWIWAGASVGWIGAECLGFS